MATDLFDGVFNQILLKTNENDHFETISNFAPVPPPHFQDNWIFLTFHQFLIYQTWAEKNWLVLVHSKQSYA